MFFEPCEYNMLEILSYGKRWIEGMTFILLKHGVMSISVHGHGIFGEQVHFSVESGLAVWKGGRRKQRENLILRTSLGSYTICVFRLSYRDCNLCFCEGSWLYPPNFSPQIQTLIKGLLLSDTTRRLGCEAAGPRESQPSVSFLVLIGKVF